MPRRYGADGTRLWNGKTPEEFTEADAYRFMAETEAVLQRKELMDDPAQPAPASGKEEFYLSKKMCIRDRCMRQAFLLFVRPCTCPCFSMMLFPRSIKAAST